MNTAETRSERVYVNMTPELRRKLEQSAAESGRGSLSADANYRLEQSFKGETPVKRRPKKQ